MWQKLILNPGFAPARVFAVLVFVNIIWLVLATFKDSLFARNQSVRLSSSMFISYEEMYIVVSSENKIDFAPFRLSGMSFVYIINSTDNVCVS